MTTFKSKLAGAVAIATCAFALGPFAAQSVAQDTRIPTVVKAYSTVADVNTTNVQVRMALRPSARLFARTASGLVPLPNKYLTFHAAGKGLCAELTDETGYAECKGIIRLLYPTLAVGRYEARFPGTATYAPSKDTGQILTLGSVEIF